MLTWILTRVYMVISSMICAVRASNSAATALTSASLAMRARMCSTASSMGWGSMCLYWIWSKFSSVWGRSSKKSVSRTSAAMAQGARARVMAKTRTRDNSFFFIGTPFRFLFLWVQYGKN